VLTRNVARSDPCAEHTGTCSLRVRGGTPAGGRSGRLQRFDGPPFRWDEDRRFLIRAELDAAFFHLYLPADPNGDWVKAESESDEDLKQLKKSFPKPRDAVDYIMDTFPIVKRKDEAAYGSYRTKEMILSIYDEMQEAIRTGGEYRTPAASSTSPTRGQVKVLRVM
jgi:hypothetical protein